MNRAHLTLTAVLTVFVVAGAAFAGNPGPPADFDSYLTPEYMDRIKAGEVVAVEKTREDAAGKAMGGGLVLAMIERSPAEVWSVLRDYSHYPEFMPSVHRLEFYDDQGPTYGLHYTLKIMLIKVEYYVRSTQDPETHSMTWLLDDGRENDIRASVGGWWIRPLEEGRSLVYYKVNVDTGSSLPRTLVNYLTRKTMPNAVKALKKRVESGGTYTK